MSQVGRIWRSGQQSLGRTLGPAVLRPYRVGQQAWWRGVCASQQQTIGLGYRSGQELRIRGPACSAGPGEGQPFGCGGFNPAFPNPPLFLNVTASGFVSDYGYDPATNNCGPGWPPHYHDHAAFNGEFMTADRVIAPSGPGALCGTFANYWYVAGFSRSHLSSAFWGVCVGCVNNTWQAGMVGLGYIACSGIAMGVSTSVKQFLADAQGNWTITWSNPAEYFIGALVYIPGTITISGVTPP